MHYTEAQKTSVEMLSSDQECHLESNQSIHTPDHRFQVSPSWQSVEEDMGYELGMSIHHSIQFITNVPNNINCRPRAYFDN